MKAHNQLHHAYDTTRHYNKTVTMTDASIAFLSDEDLGGYPLDKLFEDLKLDIVINCQKSKETFSNLETLIGGCQSYDLTEYTDKAQYQIINDKPIVDAFADTLLAAIELPQVKDKTKLADIAKSVESPLAAYLAPLQIDTANRHLIILNDWLDASSYTLRQINFNTGEPVSRTDEQIIAMVLGMLDQFENMTGFPGFSNEQKIEAGYLTSIRDKVINDIFTVPFTEIADYIDANVEKVPQMRRVWAI